VNAAYILKPREDINRADLFWAKNASYKCWRRDYHFTRIPAVTVYAEMFQNCSIRGY